MHTSTHTHTHTCEHVYSNKCSIHTVTEPIVNINCICYSIYNEEIPDEQMAYSENFYYPSPMDIKMSTKIQGAVRISAN